MTCRMSRLARISQAIGALFAGVAAVSAIVGASVGIAVLTGVFALVLAMNAVTGACPSGWFVRQGRVGVAPNSLGFPESLRGGTHATESRSIDERQ